ncbi:uncharacterized protein LOC141704734, partial [Apium graveolens]|uniref:uncharacterized protein LOC141704734 n=1 Tax=Apium graveolens TaxID=4045 RepID=UPI003D7B6566
MVNDENHKRSAEMNSGNIPSFPNKSWSNIVKDKAPEVKFDYIPLPEGTSVLSPPDEVLRKGNDKFKMCMVGTFSKVLDPVTDEKSTAEVLVHYAVKPLSCSACNSLGHNLAACPKARKIWVQKEKEELEDKSEKGSGSVPVSIEKPVEKPADNPADNSQVVSPTANLEGKRKDKEISEEGGWTEVSRHSKHSTTRKSLQSSPGSATPPLNFKKLVSVDEIEARKRHKSTSSDLKGGRARNRKGEGFVKDFVNSNNISLIALLETHVKMENMGRVTSFVSPHFDWISNHDFHDNGRILIGWDPHLWKISVLCKSAQHITSKICRISNNEEFVIFYLWAQPLHSSTVSMGGSFSFCNRFDYTLVLSRDFNVCLGPTESNSDNTRWSTGMLEFRDFLNSSGLTDLRPRGLSDHNPAFIDMGVSYTAPKKPFQLFLHFLEHPGFLELVKEAWSSNIVGYPWFRVTSKLKLVKAAVKDLNRNVGNLHELVIEAREKLLRFQASLPSCPSTDQFLEEERLSNVLEELLNREEILLKQKSRINWLEKGDRNNKFFLQSCKGRWNQNKILALDSNDFEHTSHAGISKVAVDYFSSILGNSVEVRDIPPDLQLPVLNVEQQQNLTKVFTQAEVLKTFQSLAKTKVQALMGFRMGFPALFINWIHTCLSSAMVSVKINGALEGKVSSNPDFSYHWRTSHADITHLIFADDVMLFSKGDEKSMKIMLDTISEFSLTSGLHPNASKAIVSS